MYQLKSCNWEGGIINSREEGNLWNVAFNRKEFTTPSPSLAPPEQLSKREYVLSIIYLWSHSPIYFALNIFLLLNISVYAPLTTFLVLSFTKYVAFNMFHQAHLCSRINKYTIYTWFIWQQKQYLILFFKHRQFICVIKESKLLINTYSHL